MENIFKPESVAVFGVSDSPKNLARIIVENLINFNYKGQIYPIGKEHGKVCGKKVFSNLSHIDVVPELAVLLIPANLIPYALKSCGEKGIRNVIIESGGFTEFDDGRYDLENQVINLANHFNMRVIGPNCFGVINMELGVVLPFFMINPEYIRRGNISLISQSGGIFYDTCMLCSCENIGLNKLISIGNKLLTHENDALRFLISDAGTHTIGIYLENFSDARELMDLALGTDKPILLLKANRSPAGEEIARFHTTALAGNDDVADAAIKQAGIHRVDSFQDMIDLFKVFSLPTLKGNRLAVISRSGGHGVVSADAVFRNGFELAKLSSTFFDGVKKKKLNVIRATNPLDIGDIYDISDYQYILEMALQESTVDGVVFVVTFSSESDSSKMHNFIKFTAQVSKLYNKPIAISLLTNREEWFSIKMAADIPIFTDVGTAIKSLSASYRHFKTKQLDVKQKYSNINRPGTIKTRRTESKEMMGVLETFDLLRNYKIPVAECEIVENPIQGREVAIKIGYPVVLKSVSPDIIHKTEVGGVKLNINTPDELDSAFNDIPGKQYLIQKMYPIGIEMIIGGRQDSEFGPVVLIGFGGIFVEVLHDTVIHVLPIFEKDAEAMIDRLKGSVLLKGFRGLTLPDRNALVSAIVNIGKLMMEHPEISNLEINPLIVFEQGKGACAVDARIIKKLEP
ncbi:MAG TPA: acetate--CoA ligase family protein [Syntrophorhabdaceae bacterium]|nr:acetate--CoA ligase family protein [Syntrophorhabdaceae bacterium]